MSNIVRLTACVAIIVGLLAEVGFGLLYPPRIKVERASLQTLSSVQVELPTPQQADSWCNVVVAPDRWGQRIGCDIVMDR